MSADNWENYESGPFCRHWHDAYDCDRTCRTCGHKCIEHEVGTSTACMETGCDCKVFNEPSDDNMGDC